MKKVLAVCVLVSVLIAAVPAMAVPVLTTILVDFGTTAGETVSGVTLNGWAQAEPGRMLFSIGVYDLSF